MYFMSDFCRVCLQGEKGLKDIMKDKEVPDSLYSKLKLCVSEVDWCVYKTMFMCEKCVTKLNTAFEFKCQCIKSTEILKNFLNQLGIEENKTDLKRNDVNLTIAEENSKSSKDKSELKPAPFVHLRPDQQLFTPGQLQNVILSPNAAQSGFPNLFFNLIPTSLLTPSNPPPLTSVTRPPPSKTASQVKDANQNMFVTINNTLHRIFPVISPTKDNSNVQSITNPSVVPPILTNHIQPEITKPAVKGRDLSHIFTENNSEELSIEIDPSCFDLEEEESPGSVNKSEMNILRDWEDVIVSNKISSEHDNISIRTSLNNSLPTLNKMLEVNNGLTPHDMGINNKGSNIQNPHSASVSIPPKQQPYMGNYAPIKDFEEKIEFFNAGHFMTQKEPEKASAIDCIRIFSCEMCSNTFDSLKKLNSHIKQHHSGKFPYRCKYCFMEFAVRSQFKEHLHAHLSESGDNYTKDSITLDDLNAEHHESLVLNCVNYKPIPPQKTEQTEGEGEAETGEFKCEQCPRRFNSLHGLSRHRVRKHNFKAKKKYFIKGMKNARCDICNREFSTQSYLQLHIKLHYRKSDFRRKVFCKESYTSEGNFLNLNDKNQYEEYGMLDNHMLDVDVHMDTDESFSLDANVGETLIEDTNVSSKTVSMETSLSTSNINTTVETIENSSENFAMDSSSTETVDFCLEDSTNPDLDGSCDKIIPDALLKPDLNDISDDKIKDKHKESKEEQKPLGKFNNEVKVKKSRTENKSSIENKSIEIIETVSECEDRFEKNDVSNANNHKDEKVEAKIVLSMEILAENNDVEPKKQKCEFPVLQENEKKENCDPQPLKDLKASDDNKKHSIRNDDVTVSNVGIKLKINLRNIKQNSRDETSEKNREDFVKETTQDELVAAKQQEHIEDPAEEVIGDSKKCKEKSKKSGSSRAFSKKRKGGSSKKSSRKKSKANKVKESVTDPTPTDENDVTEEEKTSPLTIPENNTVTSSDDKTPTENIATPTEMLKDIVLPLEDVIPLNSIIPVDVNLSTDETILNDTENENHTFFSGYKIEMVNGRPKCNFCNKLFSRKHDLKRHMNNIHLKAIKYKCHLCDVTFYEAFHLTRHLRQHNCFLTCAVCPKNFSALRDLKCHVDSIHKQDSSVQCGTCSIVFPNLDELKDHIQQHDREVIYKCHLCTDEFTESRELTKHLVGHSGMYSCVTCQATFATEHELNLHLKVHTLNVFDDTKYECEVCHNKYKKKRYLANHMKHSKHNLSLEKKDADEVHVNRVERNNSDDST